MANNLKSIADIFERKLFRIPDYQRGYSWETRHLQDFWDDVERIMEGKKHYTGLLTIREANLKEDDQFGKWNEDKWLIESGYEPFYIVDGQQRLTTIIIFLQAIVNRLKQGEMLAYNKKDSIIEKYIKKETSDLKSYIFGYEFNDPSNNYLRSNIFRDEDEVFKQSMTLYTSNLENSRKFFNERIKGLPHGELDKIFKKLTLKLQFNLHTIEDELDEFIVFETTNNRGKPLSKLELLKNRLIYLTTIIPNYNQDESKEVFEEQRKKTRRSINQTWKNVYEYLGKNDKNLLDDDDFLKNHFYMYYGYDTDTAAVVDKILLDEKFTAKDAQSRKINFKDIEDYIGSLSKAALEWFRLNNPNHPEARFSYEVIEWLEKLRRQNYPPFSVCIMTALLLKTRDSELLELIKTMERYHFLVFGLSKRRSNTGISLFYQRAHHVWKKDKTIHDLKNEIDSRMKNEQLGHDFKMNRFKVRILDELFNSPDPAKVGFYGWTELMYFLFEYEIWLQQDEEQKVKWQRAKGTVEHIYPRTDTEPCWQDRFGKFNPEQKKYLLNNIGNLLLLSRSKNASQSNHCFEFKKKHEKKGKFQGYFNGSHSEIEVSQYDDWTPNEILKRSLKMLSFMEKRWNLEIGDNDRKMWLLGLDFLKNE